MFYYNTKYKFALAKGSPDAIVGGIVAASAMFIGQLQRRGFTKYPYLQHRLFDPQLYLATLDPFQAPDTVGDLASFPWFGVAPVEIFDTAKHKKQSAYKEEFFPQLRAGWRRAAPSDPAEVRTAARSAVEFQLEMDCRAIILAAPMVQSPARGYEEAAVWIDAGLEACRALGVTLPVYATVAICDTVLQNLPAATNPLLDAITGHVAARDALAGAYLVIESRDGDAYSFESQDTARSVIKIIDDLVRGARRRVIINYAGTFGAVCMAAGAEIWSSGYYLSQRRLKGSDLHTKKGGRQLPRYYSLHLAGDIGLERDLDAIVQKKLLPLVRTPAFSPVEPAAPLHAALEAGLRVGSVPGWAYQQTNVTAAGAHYNWCMYRLGQQLERMNAMARVEWVDTWLARATERAKRIQDAGVPASRATELTHQRMWLQVYRDWKAEAGHP